MVKFVEKARARWKRWKASVRHWLLRRQSSSSLRLSASSSSSFSSFTAGSNTTRVGNHLMGQLDIESNRVSYRTAIFTCREHVTNQLSAFNYHETRTLLQLANFAPVMRLLQAGTESALNILKPTDFNAKESWHRHLQEERDEQMQIFTSLLTDDELVRREMGNEEQQLEILTLLKFGLENHSDVLTAAELDVMSAAYDKVVRLSDTIVVELPDWFAVSDQRWIISRVTVLDRGEEECIRTASLWSELNHPNVRNFFGACPVGEMPFLIHEESEEFFHDRFWGYVLDIARGLEYLDDRGLVHQSLSTDSFCTTSFSMRGAVSGMGLVRVSTEDSRTNGSSIHEPSFPSDRLMFRNILADLVEVYASGFDEMMPWNESSSSSPSSSQESCSSQNERLLSEAALILPDATPSSSQLLMSDSTPSQNQSIREALAEPSPTKPSFVEEEIWSLLVEMCSEEAGAGVTWKRIIHKIDLLAQQERLQGSTTGSDRHPDELIESLEEFTFDGQSTKTMLDEAQTFCAGLQELRTVNQPVLTRLVDIYEQLHRRETPLKRFVVEDFCMIIRRFNAQLDRSPYSSQVASVCASRTIAGRNYSIHHDIDRLIHRSPSLSDKNPVHSWQSGWTLVQQQHSDAVQALLANPATYLNDLNTDAERREASVLLQFEALHCGTARKSTTRPTLSSIDEGEEVPDWFIPPHEIEFGRHLADGAFGAVYEGTWRGTDVVVKQILTDQNSAEARSQFRQEVDLWYSLNHDHLIKLYGACHVGRAAFVCERATQGTLVSYVKGKERYEIWRCIYEAALGLRHLHDRGIVHGDLKGNNILVCQKNVKLADFGLSFSTKQADSTVLGAAGALGAYRWKAPECLIGCKPTFASDIYSFGMCIIEVLSGELPWGSTMDAVVKHKVVEQKLFPTQPDHIDGHDWRLASRMCSFDPGERITANTVASFAYDQYQALQYWHDEEQRRNLPVGSDNAEVPT